MSKLKVDELRSADRSVSSTANITLADDGNTSLGGTLSAGTIGNNVAVEGSFGVTDITNQFTIQSGWSYDGSAIDQAIKAYHFNGFVFMQGSVSRGSGSSTSIFLINQDYRPTVEAYMPVIGYQADSAWYLRVQTDGYVRVETVINNSSGTFYITFNGFYKI